MIENEKVSANLGNGGKMVVEGREIIIDENRSVFVGFLENNPEFPFAMRYRNGDKETSFALSKDAAEATAVLIQEIWYDNQEKIK